MKKLLLFLIACVFISAISFSQATWVEQTAPPVVPPLYSVNAFSSLIAWASGDNGTVLLTTNGGINWVYKDAPQAGNFTIYGINGLDPVTALCLVNTTNAGLILKTTNSGNTWNIVFARPGQYLDDMKFINSTTGYVYGDPLGTSWFFIKTTNAGITWDTTVTRPTAAGFEQGFENGMFVQNIIGNLVKIWFGSDNGFVIFSLNNAASWGKSPTPSNNQVRGITFLDANTGFCGGQKPFLSGTSGNNWIFQANYPNLGTFHSFANSAGYVWYASGTGICYSTDQGANFTLQHSSPDNSDYTHMSFTLSLSDVNLTTITGWGISDNGVISKYSQANIGIHQISTEIPNGYILEQNYPNPFNPATKIRFSIPFSGYIALNAYDILGRLVKNIFKGNLKPGNYETDFDASELSSGLYFYKLESEKFTEVKKMIVVK